MEEFELEPGERVTRSVRKHWFVFLCMLLPYIFLALIPLFLPAIFTWATRAYPGFSTLLGAISFANPFTRLVLGVWWFILWVGAFNAFTSYFLNVWVITTQRIVKISQPGFFNRRVASFLLIRVQDVSTTVDGFFAEIFGYGCVRVETAGTESSKFLMDGVANPVGMRDLIMREIAVLHPTQHSGL